MYLQRMQFSVTTKAMAQSDDGKVVSELRDLVAKRPLPPCADWFAFRNNFKERLNHPVRSSMVAVEPRSGVRGFRLWRLRESARGGVHQRPADRRAVLAREIRHEPAVHANQHLGRGVAQLARGPLGRFA